MSAGLLHVLRVRILGARPQFQSVFLLRRDCRAHLSKFFHQWGDGCLQSYLRSWIHHHLQLRTIYLLQGMAHMSITRYLQMRAPVTGDTIFLHSHDLWPLHCISWWGWEECTRCLSPNVASYFPIFDSWMRLLWCRYLICRRSQSGQGRQPSCGNRFPFNHQQLLRILF